MDFADDGDEDCVFVMQVSKPIKAPGAPKRHSNEYFSSLPTLGSDGTEGDGPEGGALDLQGMTRVEAYYGNDQIGTSHAVLGACFKALETPAQLRQLVGDAIAAGPVSTAQRPKPAEEYGHEEGSIRRAFTLFSMAAMGEPTGMILSMPKRILTLVAHGSQVFLVDHQEQPSARGKIPVLGGEGALVMTSPNVFAAEEYIKSHYDVGTFVAQIFQKPGSVLVVEETPVDKPISRLSLENVVVVEVNEQGKRARTPPLAEVISSSQGAALGSPRAENTEAQPKRAKTPPQAPVALAMTDSTTTPVTAKAEKRKSVPVSSRKSASAAAPVAAPVAATTTTKKEAAAEPTK
jgi:hypothetical protein